MFPPFFCGGTPILLNALFIVRLEIDFRVFYILSLTCHIIVGLAIQFWPFSGTYFHIEVKISLVIFLLVP